MSVDADVCRHLARLAARCNELLSAANDAQQFVTLFCAIVDVTDGLMYFVNAGHNPPLLRVPGADPVFLRTPRNPLAGIVPGLEYAVGSHAFPPGSLCVLYTDGVTEAENGAGAMFGDDALLDIVARHGITDADSCVDKIVAAVDEFAAGQPQADDITVLAVYRP
jgi:phosphoserine phosphatase RsbU/P